MGVFSIEVNKNTGYFLNITKCCLTVQTTSATLKLQAWPMAAPGNLAELSMSSMNEASKSVLDEAREAWQFHSQGLGWLKWVAVGRGLQECQRLALATTHSKRHDELCGADGDGKYSEAGAFG
jgi:hypothetical protein